MKSIFLSLFLFVFVLKSIAQDKEKPETVPAENKPLMFVEVACGQCQFGLKGKTCDLAIRFDGKSYFVDGSDIDSHGDAHAKEGLCNAIRKAEVQGKLTADRFKVSYIKLLPEPVKSKGSKQ